MLQKVRQESLHWQKLDSKSEQSARGRYAESCGAWKAGLIRSLCVYRVTSKKEWATAQEYLEVGAFRMHRRWRQRYEYMQDGVRMGLRKSWRTSLGIIWKCFDKLSAYMQAGFVNESIALYGHKRI